ncbi:MAG: 50S ribosomal protein L4 [Candidatus Micrarchaeota archaeon]|nr:MAG: 50S ribosomal protein L4 [Candidatus Micrarchaeota archaeon]
MQADVYDINGKIVSKIELPKEFSKEYRKDLIIRALLAENTLRLQPQGHAPEAGMQASVSYVGRRGAYRSQVHTGRPGRPRQKLSEGRLGDVRRIPSAVKGRRAHPHKVEKNIIEVINNKEYTKAIISAIAYTNNAKEVYKIDKDTPIIVEDAIEKISKTKDLVSLIKRLGLEKQLEDVEKRKRIRKGLRRSARQRSYKKWLLFVTLDSNADLLKAARNIKGVDAVPLEKLSVDKLVPGGNNPRIVIWSLSSVKNIDKIKNLRFIDTVSVNR